MIAGDLLGERARLTPEKTALVEVRSGRRFSYREIDQLAAALARQWSDLGLAKGARVAILAENCAAYVAAFFAAGKSGVVLVPLNTRLAPPELQAVVDDCGAHLLLYSGACSRLAESVSIQLKLALEEIPIRECEEAAPVHCDPEDLWCLLYTSGTTGRPKGVMLPHRMVIWNAYNTVTSWQLREDDIAPVFTPMYHAGGLAVFLTPLVAIGGTVVLHEHFEPSEIWQTAARERATLIFGVPTIFQRLLEDPEFATADLASVRWLISGGAPLPRYLLDRYRERGLVFKQGYGLTEAGVNCFAMTTEDACRKPGSIGKPMLFVETSIRSADGQPAPAAETGELWLRGAHVSKGYWRQPEATAALRRGRLLLHRWPHQRYVHQRGSQRLPGGDRERSAAAPGN
jgi:fatty-acyl-CoA synthase